ncbi:GIY-YIG catalytic domain-containing protein [Nemania sp. FL0916]|nr:GIY-YIG catalytic domain-containing protein [Nemania sp. FL0916]
MSKPIPALYVVYILRSTVRHSSLYIGSTPNPPRRLKQHNGDAKGGAARTSRATLRPWEMVSVVSGFPSRIAALQFEWALNNPHLTLHIPAESRISIATSKKRSGHPRRPRPSLKSIISNVHLLLSVPSFARWPLEMRFFAPEVHRAWTTCCNTASEPLHRAIPVHTHFAPRESAAAGENVSSSGPWGIHALPINYAPMKSYVEKTQSLYTFEREGACVVCGESLPHDEGLYATCSNEGCEGTGHLSCWSRHLLGANAEEHIIPISGHCPACEGEVVWGDMMKEMSLRLRGQKEVEKLLKKPRKRKAKPTATDTTDYDSSDQSSSPWHPD